MMTKLTAALWHWLVFVMEALYHSIVIAILMMVVLFHAVPHTISLLWDTAVRYVGLVAKKSRLKHTTKTKSDQMDAEIGVESAMPHIFNRNTQTQHGEQDTTSEQKIGGHD